MSRAPQLAAPGVALAVLGGAFGVSPLYVPAVALLVIAAVAEATVRIASRHAVVELELPAASVEEGSAASLRVRAGGWPFLVSRGQLEPLPGSAAVRVPFRGLDDQLVVRPQRRGRYGVGPSTVRFADPFGICSGRRASAPATITVLPRLERIRREDLELMLGLSRARSLRDDGTEVEGLRPYRPGAPASRIHWLTVARTGELVERRAEQDADGMPVMIVLDAAAPADADALDAAVRAAASLCVGLAATGGCSLLLPGTQEAQPVRADLSSWPYLHARLALLESGGRPLWRVAARAPVVIWVGARRPEPGLGAGRVACTVSPVRRDDRDVMFRLSGCAVQPAGRAAARAA
ncbi:MAG: DUF58 domain-containing protein [Solirubrobacteraceae bacterium]